MLNNLVRHSLRSFRRQRSYLIINVLGLSVGIACSLIISLFVFNELSYDRFNTKKDRIYRLNMNFRMNEQDFTGSWSAPIMGPTLTKEFPEVEDFLRMTIFSFTAIEVEYNKQAYAEEHLIQADSSFFNFFSIPLLKGDPKNLLNAPRKLVLSESTARKIFGSDDPIDKTLKIGEDSMLYTISGVMADIPDNSHFEANIISSFMTNQRSKEQMWSNNSVSTYLLLKPNSKIQDVEKKMTDLIMSHAGEEIKQYMGITMEEFLAKGNRYGYFFQNLKDIHLDPSIKQEFKEAGDPKYLTILGSLAILIILIAAINFMNLSTAQASRRAKEVGIKKIGGSTRGMLITQFLTESYILTAVSMIFAIFLVKLSIPYVNNLLGANLAFKPFDDGYTLPVLILFSILVGFLSGSYPALYISSFNPYEVLKWGISRRNKIGMLRRILVVFQFSVSILLIVGTLIMYKQIKYMLNKDLGFEKEQLVVIKNIEKLGTKVKTFKEEVGRIPGVAGIVSSSSVPGQNNNNNGYGIEGRKDETALMWTNFIDYDYLDTYGMTLISGRTFNKLFTADRYACIINESAVKKYAITDLENTRIIEPGDTSKSKYMRIIGVVKNYNTESLHSQVQPCILRLDNGEWPFGYLSVKLSGKNKSKTISEIENIWKENTANKPFEYYFLDDGLKRMYIKEKQSMQMAVLFSILAIFIAALGLFGLTSYTVEQKTKEIGVRKAMGSSVASVFFEISKEVMILVTISSLIALPIIYYIAGKWLENFYYRISPGVFSFLAGLAIALGIALLTISYSILKAAKINPAQSLKYE